MFHMFLELCIASKMGKLTFLEQLFKTSPNSDQIIRASPRRWRQKNAKHTFKTFSKHFTKLMLNPEMSPMVFVFLHAIFWKR